MNENYLELLESADSPIYAEYLPGFNIREADAKFDKFVKALEQRLGCALPNKDNYSGIQDGGFHGMVLLPSDLFTGEYGASLRVSNFGNFATIFDDDEEVKPEVFLTIDETLEEFGYVYIPSKVLNTPYTGNNPGVTGFHSWGHRYFDWT